LGVLQAAINALCQWADAWQLSISVEKSCVRTLHWKNCSKYTYVHQWCLCTFMSGPWSHCHIRLFWPLL